MKEFDANEYNANGVDMSIREEAVSLSGVNPWLENDSSPRGCMFLTQFSQEVTLDRPEVKIYQTGIEKQLVDNTFKVLVEDDIVVKAVITDGVGGDINELPMITIIGASIATGELDIYEIPYYFSLHQYFGFRYKRTKVLEEIYVGKTLLKGTVLAETPGVVDNSYCYGVNANIALITDPAGGQDGVIISDYLAEKLQYKIYVKGSLEWGADSYPLNMYGTIDNYKAFPEYGESIGPDQVFGVIREYDKDVGPALASKRDTMEFDPIFDKAYYVRPTKKLRCKDDIILNNKVVSLNIIHSPNSKKEPLYNNEQTERIMKQNKKYTQTIVNTYESLTKNGKISKIVSPRFQRKLTDAYTILPDDEKIVYKFRNDKVDLYRAEFVIEYTIQPGIGAKLSDSHGAKGIIVDVRKRSTMPRDMYGNYADIIMDPTSIPSRMNSGRTYESYFNASSRNTRRMLLDNLVGSRREGDFILLNDHSDAVENATEEKLFETYNMLLEFLKIVATEQYDYYYKYRKDINSVKAILSEISSKELYLYYKVSSKKRSPLFVNDLEQTKFKVPREPIYINGKKTRSSITIGTIYCMLLNKTADGYLASASANINHYGMPVRVNSSLKTGMPYINNPTKIIGETECRMVRNNSKSPILAAELKDRASSITTHKEIYYNVLKADKPTNIDVAVSRDKFPYGEDNSLMLIKDIFNTTGANFEYVEGVD